MKRQSGVTLIGVIFFLGLISVVALLGFKVTPFYIDYFSMQSMLKNLATEKTGATDTELRYAFAKYANTNYLNAYSPNDMTIDRGQGMLTLSVDVDKKAPLFAGITLCMHLEAKGEASLR
jgi:hypothetical protein